MKNEANFDINNGKTGESLTKMRVEDEKDEECVVFPHFDDVIVVFSTSLTSVGRHSFSPERKEIREKSGIVVLFLSEREYTPSFPGKKLFVKTRSSRK